MSDDERGRGAKVTTEVIDIEWKGALVAILKAQGIHEGVWEICVRLQPTLGLKANIKLENGQGVTTVPGAMVPLGGLAITRVELVGPLAVDAAVVNPRKTLITRVH